MSVVTKLSNAAYCGYVIGKAVEQRHRWMERARDAQRNHESESEAFAVQAARRQSREIVEQLRLLRQGAQS